MSGHITPEFREAIRAELRDIIGRERSPWSDDGGSGEPSILKKPSVVISCAAGLLTVLTPLALCLIWMGEVRSSLGSMNADIGGMKTAIAEIPGIKANVSQLKADMVEVRADISTMKSDISGVKSEIMEIKLSMQEKRIKDSLQFAAINSRLTRIEGRVR